MHWLIAMKLIQIKLRFKGKSAPKSTVDGVWISGLLLTLAQEEGDKCLRSVVIRGDWERLAWAGLINKRRRRRRELLKCRKTRRKE